LLFQLVYFLLLNLCIVRKTIIGLVVVIHMLLKLLCCAGDLLDLLLQLEVDLFGILHLFSVLLLLFFHSFSHIFDLI